MFCVLAMDNKGALVLISEGDFSDRLDSVPVQVPVTAVDQRCRCVAFSLHRGAIKLAVLNPTGRVCTMFDSHIYPAEVIDGSFLDQCGERPVRWQSARAPLVVNRRRY